MDILDNRLLYMDNYTIHFVDFVPFKMVSGNRIVTISAQTRTTENEPELPKSRFKKIKLTGIPREGSIMPFPWFL